MKKGIAINLSALKELKTYHYKVILYLDGVGAATQSQMSEYFGTTKQRISVICIELKSMDIIKINRKEGRNVFWELNPEPKLQIKGQVKMEGV